MGAVNINNTGSGSSVVLSSDGTSLLLNGTAIGGGSSTLVFNNQTAAYTVVSGDAGKIINCSGATSFTVSLTAAATLGSGFNCVIWNNTTTTAMAVTIDPNASETIDGLTTIILRQGEGTQIVCDGTNWQTGNKKTMRGYAENYSSATNRPVVIANGSVALGNSYISGSSSFAVVGNGNTSTYGAQGSNSLAIGPFCKANGIRSVSMGYLCTASATDSYAIGNSANASVQYAVGIGQSASSSGGVAFSSGLYGATANADGSVVLGNGVSGLSELGKFIFGGFRRFATAGQAQSGMTVLGCATTDATATVLTVDTNAPGNNNQIPVYIGAAIAFDGLIVARQQIAGGTASAAWKVEGLIRKESTAASTTLVASTVTAISNVPAWTLALTADTTNGALAITFTGAAATNIRTVATIRTSEVLYY